MSDEEEEQRQADAKQQSRLARLQRDEDLRAVLATGEGRRLVWRLINDMGATFSGSFATDVALMAFQEGRRSIGREVMTEAQRVSKAGYLLMLQERLAELPDYVPEKPTDE